jgi:predicted RNase H-like HicB family nuclease
MKEIDYIIWKEDKYYVSQCLNFEVSSFGETIEESIKNLLEAVELYLEDEKVDYQIINNILVGKQIIHSNA